MPRRPLVLMTLLLAACSAGSEVASPPPAAPSVADGRIVEGASGTPVALESLLERLSAADYVLLGEKHDNADHHALQAEIVRQLQARGRPRAVAFEMMGTDQQLQIVEYVDEHGDDVRGLGEALAWEQSGWPDWLTMYGPIAQAAVDGGGEIVAANLPRDQIREVYSTGSATLHPALVERSGLAEQLPEVLAVDLREDLIASHCGEDRGEMIDGMFRVQRARDAIMADRLVAASGSGGGVLIAGAQHVRNDRGVPWYVARLEPEAEVVSVAFVEADPPAEGEHEAAPFDYLWYTGELAGQPVDPCAAFHKVGSPAEAPATSG